MNKIIYVPTFFKIYFEEIEIKVPTGKYEKNLYGRDDEVICIEKKLQEKKSDCLIDGERLSKDIAIVVKELNSENYEVINTIPIISGSNTGKICLTEGVTIIARKNTIMPGGE